MKTFRVRIKLATKSGAIEVQVQARTEAEAKTIAAAQFPNGKILTVGTGR